MSVRAGHVHQSLCAFVALFSLGVTLPRPAYGNGVTMAAIDFNGNPGSGIGETITEGGSAIYTYEITNNSDTPIVGGGFNAYLAPLPGSDRSEIPIFGDVSLLVSNSCQSFAAGMELVVGSSCFFDVFFTSPFDQGETDSDFLSANVIVQTSYVRVDNNISVSLVNFDDTLAVQDLSPSTIPEPSGLLLLGTGFVGLRLTRRKSFG